MRAGEGSWLLGFADSAAKTDRFIGHPHHVALLAAGLLGETGSVLAELKKEQREQEAYPAYRRRMLEEIGDCLWYFVRLVTVVDAALLRELDAPTKVAKTHLGAGSLPRFLELGAAVGDVVAAIKKGGGPETAGELRALLSHAWSVLTAVSRDAQVALQEAAAANTRKTESRWPSEKVYVGLFDNDFPEEEQLPRELEIEFRERSHGAQKVVILRCNGINFGDRLTDNIEDPDGYRYHDIFHFSYAVHLGWSPVIRALLKCKRKSRSKTDEGQDGARAGILEEAASAIVFSRAKHLSFFDQLDRVDFDLLKTVREFVDGFEVERVPLWQWETAILDGFRIFRLLRVNHGGRVILDLEARKLTYIAPVPRS